MSLKAFVMTYAVFKKFGSNSIFDFDLDKLHILLNNRLNEAFGPFNIKPR